MTLIPLGIDRTDEHPDACDATPPRAVPLCLPAAPALPALPPPSEPYGLLPQGTTVAPREREERPSTRRFSTIIGIMATLAAVVLVMTEYALIVLPHGEPAFVEDLSADPETSQFGDIDDFPYVPSTVEESIELSLLDNGAIALSPSDFDKIRDEEGLYAFSLSGKLDVPVLPPAARSRISSAISGIEDRGGTVSCLFVDVESGLGYAYNVDEEIYGASSFKAPLASYVLSHAHDVDGVPSSTMSQIRSSIEQSDNAAFISLSGKYRHSSAFDSWLAEELAIGDGKRLFRNGDFATYSARDGAKMWMFMSHYLDSGTEGAAILAESCSNTNKSFIRDGVEASREEVVEYELEDKGGKLAIALAPPEDIEVYNKAGWYPGPGSSSSTTDNAIIDVDGHRYIMCILTSLPYSDKSASCVSELAAALFSARGCLVARDVPSDMDEREVVLVVEAE